MTQPDRDSADHPLGRDEYATLASFRKAIRRFLHATEAEARAVGITPQQHQLMLATYADPERDWATVGEIADFLQLHHHATVGLVDRCQLAGLVERHPDPRDRRVVRVAMTEKGRSLLGNITRRNLPEVQALSALTVKIEELHERDLAGRFKK
jgi:DNA-binding MarR family transcriptional regulator